MPLEDTSYTQEEDIQGTRLVEEGMGTYNVLSSQTFCRLLLLNSPLHNPHACSLLFLAFLRQPHQSQGDLEVTNFFRSLGEGETQEEVEASPWEASSAFLHRGMMVEVNSEEVFDKGTCWEEVEDTCREGSKEVEAGRILV